MQIILKKDVDNLGQRDDMVVVKDGYAMNYLIPQGLATFATPSAIKMRDENLKQRAHKIAKMRQEAEKQAKDLAAMVVTVGAKVGENGKIFGSVNAIQLADAIKKLGIEVERKNIKIKNEDTIKHVGKYEAEVKVYKDITANITFEVVEE